MATRSDYHRLIDRGRKAGLTTTELYGALAGRRPTPVDMASPRRDGNGFAADFDAAGHPVFQVDRRNRGV